MSLENQQKSCEICFRSFSRSEHLARHRRIHTKEKPFTCPYCRRSFQRSDVKAAHVRKCDAALDNRSDDALRKRARIACDGCRRRKMRCNGGDPCAKCLATESICQYSGPATSSSGTGGRTPVNADSTTGTEVNADFAPQIPDLQLATPSTDPSDFDMIDLNPPFGENQNAPCLPAPSTLEGINYDIPLGPGDDFFQFMGVDGMGEHWQMTPTDAPFWFGGESDSVWSNVFLDPDPPVWDCNMPPAMEQLTGSMQEYFKAKSRAPSPSPKVWYAAPPALTDHNQEIVRIFSNIFHRHIPHTFSLFKGPVVNGKGRTAYHLALAAVGGLFCDVSGSSDVSKSMYNDARRLLLASFGRSSVLDDGSSESLLVAVKTFVLLALYGLCSGDKRSYEFTEAFHSHLTDPVREYCQQCKPTEPGKQQESTRLLEALYILDCYRVVIIQCPPSLTWHHPDLTGRFSDPMERISLLHSKRPVAEEPLGLASLASLSPFLWPAIYPRQNRYGSNDISVESVSLWKADMIELACDKWLRSQEHPNASDLTLFHLMNIMLHANLTVIQSFVHSAPNTAARDPKKSLAAMEIHGWTQSRHFKVAHWHAERIITAVEGNLSSRSEVSNQRASGLSGTERRLAPFEAPHVPYAVYFATLIIWCGAMIDETATSASASILRGERILSLHKVHVAQLLSRVLSEVK